MIRAPIVRWVVAASALLVARPPIFIVGFDVDGQAARRWQVNTLTGRVAGTGESLSLD